MGLRLRGSKVCKGFAQARLSDGGTHLRARWMGWELGVAGVGGGAVSLCWERLGTSRGGVQTFLYGFYSCGLCMLTLSWAQVAV